MLSFVAATLAYVFDPSLANDKLYLVIVMLIDLLGADARELLRYEWTLRLNNPARDHRHAVPRRGPDRLGAYWLIAGKHNAIPFHAASSPRTWATSTTSSSSSGVLLGYAGIEMAGFHAKETRNSASRLPARDLLAAAADRRRLDPRDARDRVRRAAGETEPGCRASCRPSHLLPALGIGAWATKLMAALVGLGTLALISTWLLGPSKGLYASETTGDLPPELHYVNKRHVPVAILVFQGTLARSSRCCSCSSRASTRATGC